MNETIIEFDRVVAALQDSQVEVIPVDLSEVPSDQWVAKISEECAANDADHGFLAGSGDPSGDTREPDAPDHMTADGIRPPSAAETPPPDDKKDKKDEKNEKDKTPHHGPPAPDGKIIRAAGSYGRGPVPCATYIVGQRS